MATPVNTTREVGCWRGKDVNAAAVETAVRRLREQHELGAVRTATFTLIALVDDDALASQASEVVHELSADTPMRTLVVVSMPAGVPGVDVRVAVREVTRRAGTNVCVEEIVIRARGPVAHHLDFLVEPYTLPGLPVVLWLPVRPPRADEPLVGSVDRIVVDSPRIGAVFPLSDLAELSRRTPVTDLAWVRQKPWRQLLASLFMATETIAFIPGIRDVVVKGEPGSRQLMAGWLLSRLPLSPSVVHLLDAESDSVEIRARHLGERAQFTLTVDYEARELRAEATVQGGLSYRRAMLLPSSPLAALIGRGLATSGHDLAWERAATATLRLAP